MKKILAILSLAAVLAGCGRKSALLPKVSGKAGEVVVVIDRENWEGAAGNAVRELLACECPYLPQSEPLYSLVNVAPGGFGDLFKVHRNIVYCEVDPQTPKTGVTLRKDVWASPQCVVQVSAPDAERLAEVFASEGRTIVAALEQAERDRVIRNSILYEERSIAPEVRKAFGGSPHFPSGYKMKKNTGDFIWIADEKQFSTQGILIYSYPVDSAEPFSVGEIISHRNEAMKANVPGMFDGTYMTTSTFWAPTVEYVKYNGRNFAQTRGLWEVENDYMGGPFVSHSFYSEDGSRIIVAEAFVYAPRYDKRQLLRQVESILYSWE